MFHLAGHGTLIAPLNVKQSATISVGWSTAGDAG
jgi:hypothetical protein